MLRAVKDILLISFPAVLVLIWDFSMYSHNYLFRKSIIASTGPNEEWYFTLVTSYLGFLLFPFLGVLADVWIGRYKAILVGISLCFVAWIIGSIGIIVNGIYSTQPFLWTSWVVAFLFQLIGYSNFRANAIQYNIDQVVGASANKLSTIICWHSAAVPITRCCIHALQCISVDEATTFITSGVLITIVIVTHSLFKHKLENISLIKNPIKLIVRVLCYAKKHKYPESRSALTYWEGKAPSRLDLGKEKYGGPFTEEEVEDVKTIFRMLPLLIVVVGFACSDDHVLTVHTKSDQNNKISTCLLSLEFGYFICNTVLLMLYMFVIRLCFHKYIPSMLVRMAVGLLFALASVIFKLILFNYDHDPHYIQKLLFIPQAALEAISNALIIPASLEFTVAQSPVYMRGIMVSFWIASWSVGYFISISIKFGFHCQGRYICRDFYFYLTEIIIIIIITIVFILLAKCYKYRVRENDAHIYQIAEDHYQKYLEQEEKNNHQ